MKHAVATLTGPALDHAVAKAFGLVGFSVINGEPFIWNDDQDRLEVFSPSTLWADGGPILEAACARLEYGMGHWTATCLVPIVDGRIDLGWPHDRMHMGDTPLVAAMRAYVASRLGDDVELP
jgi:hypothetical protein